MPHRPRGDDRPAAGQGALPYISKSLRRSTRPGSPRRETRSKPASGRRPVFLEDRASLDVGQQIQPSSRSTYAGSCPSFSATLFSTSWLTAKAVLACPLPDLERSLRSVPHARSIDVTPLPELAASSVPRCCGAAGTGSGSKRSITRAFLNASMDIFSLGHGLLAHGGRSAHRTGMRLVAGAAFPKAAGHGYPYPTGEGATGGTSPAGTLPLPWANCGSIAVIRSMGKGKMMVEFFSTAISVRVCM